MNDHEKAVHYQLRGRRLWAVAALVLATATVVLAIVAVVQEPEGLWVLACVVAALAGLAFGLVRRGPARFVALTVAVLFLAGAVAVVIAEHDSGVYFLVVAGVVATLAAARYAFLARVAWPTADPPSHPVLFYNPLSGGGKAERFHLAEEARSRGIEPIELRRGVDLEQLVRDAVDRGADGLAMAGGDGSQAIVAMVAAERGLPYACIPSGTRNHFALDLGVDRNDVVGALEAFVNGGERWVDLAEVNGRVFVNNVSLGLYAEAVQRKGYREAKLRTLVDTLPDDVGPAAKPPALHWQSPDGRESALALLVSNNPYRLGRAIGSGTRPHLDQRLLGIAALAPTPTNGGRSLERRLRMQQWTAPTFEMNASERVPAGIDGEAVLLDPPLRFRIRPGALRVRIAPSHPGASPSAIEPDTPWGAVQALAYMAIHGSPRQGASTREPGDSL